MKKRRTKEEPGSERRKHFVIPDGYSVVINAWDDSDAPIYHELWDADKWHLTNDYFQDICKQERVVKAQLLLFLVRSSPPTQDREMRESILLENYEK